MAGEPEIPRVAAALAVCFDEVSAPYLAVDDAYVSVSASWRSAGGHLLTLTMSASSGDEDDLDDEERA